MTPLTCNPDVLPVGGNHKYMTRRSQVLVAGSPPMTDHNMTARMASIRTADICNVNRIASTPGRLYRKEEVAVNVPATDKDDEFPIDLDDVRPMYGEVQCMTISVL